MIKLGDKIKDFALYNQDGELIRLSDIKSKYIVLYFYPKDLTGGCTKEACNYKENFEELKNKDVTIVGISKDSVKSHSKFRDKYALPFMLLADEELEVIKYFDLWAEKKLYGKTYMGTLRKTYILNNNLEVIYINDKVSVTKDALDSLAFIEKFESQN